MAKERDYKRSLEQRNLRAYEQGYRGKGGGVSGAYAASRRKREQGEPLPTDRTARPDLRQVIRLPDGRRLVNPRGAQGDKIARSQLGKGKRFSVRVTVNTPDGPREVDLFKRGGWRADELRQLIDSYGSLNAAIAHLVNDGDGNADGLSGGAFTAPVSGPDIGAVELTVR